MDINPDAAIAVGYLKPKSLLTRFLVGLFEFSLRRSDRIVVLDRWMKERIIARGAKPERIVVIPPWPAHDWELLEDKPRVHENNFRKIHGLAGKFVVLYSGNHSIVHPLDTLLAAAIRLKDDDNFRFVFIGSGLRAQEVERCMEKYDLKNVLKLPHQPRESSCRNR